ncbi:MAG: hypothetical protein EA386_09170 [Rhodobacteraceae bacterium]|nr:MAG: hypothetical protein EA386_09170 [Paracoccaceae bacterium]
MRVIAPILLGGLLAACASPEQRCVRTAQADLVELDRQIAESERTLARGYRDRPEVAGRTTLHICAWPREPVLFCTQHTPRQPATREAVNVPAEQARLASLRAQRDGIAAAAARAMSACRAG